ncbi:DUF5801 repeats-in-toxin domain-containing protein [Kiloniella litopenaei]|uniref:DUF5801 repeats-in-toxin domain-containing protein n=1 Tax=Kiloniella litopenaei TaxID=1549748 RepID=UPI003BADA9BA
MTESFTNTGDEKVSGEEGQDLLVGQAASVVEITAPTGGETKTVSLERGQTANLNFDATAATPVLEGNDFVLTFDSNGDGSADSRIVFQNLVEDAQGEDAPVLVIGGVELPAGLLIGQAQALVEGETLETAAGAGAGPQGGGGSTYDENLGDIIDLLQAQQALGGTGLEFGLLANGDDITDPAEGTFDLTFLTVTTDIPDDGGEGGETYVSGSFSGGFEDWQPNQHLGDQEEFPMQVEFNFTPADNETLDSVVIEALPEGVTLYIGGTDDADIFAGPFPVTVLPEDFDSVFILPPEHSDADITVNATANISDPDSGESASIPATAVAVVDAAADMPTFGGEPIAVDNFANVNEVEVTGFNLTYIADVSGSMSLNGRLASMKAALKALNAEYDGFGVPVTVTLIPFNSGVNPAAVQSFSLSDPDGLTNLDAAIDALAAGGGTNFNTPLDVAAADLQADVVSQLDGTINRVYFLSDGNGSLSSSVLNAWKAVEADPDGNPLTSHNVETIGVAISSGANLSDLNQIDSDGNSLIVINPSDLTASLQGTVAVPVSGNVITDDINVPGSGGNPGTTADSLGSGNDALDRLTEISFGGQTFAIDDSNALIESGSGSATASYNPATNLLTITTDDGVLRIYMDDNGANNAGDYSYQATGGNSGNGADLFSYTIADLDGDTASANLFVQVSSGGDNGPTLTRAALVSDTTGDSGSPAPSLKDVSVNEEGADRVNETLDQADAGNTDIELPVTVTFPDYADDSEVHELVLDDVPKDWSIKEISNATIWQIDGADVYTVTFDDAGEPILTLVTDDADLPAAVRFAITDADTTDDETPPQPLEGETAGDNFVRYIIDVSERVDAQNDAVDDGGNYDDSVDGNGSVTTTIVFDPNDWTNSRLANGEEHDGGSADVSIRAVSTEVGNEDSGSELTDADGTPVDENNQAIAGPVTVNVSIEEDVPELQPVTLVHDETPGIVNDDDQGNQNGGEHDVEINVPSEITDSFARMFGAQPQPTLAAVNEDEKIILPPRPLPEAIGQAVNSIHYDLKTDGANDEENNSDLANNNAATDAQEAIEFDLSSVNLNGMESAGSVVSLQQDPTDPQVVWGVNEDGGVVFALHIDGTLNDGDNTGQITFVQYAQIDHSTDGDGGEGEYDDPFSFELAYKVTDDEGDSTSQTVTVTVQDDGPSIEASSAAMDESDALYGTYSLFGADETVTIDVANAGQDSAGYHNTIGYYVSDADGNPIGGEIIQPDAHDLTSTSITFNKADYPEGATVGIFLIPNGDNQNTGLAAGDDVTFKFEGGKWVAYKGADALSGSQEPAYFSNSGLNPDGSTHVIDNGYPGNQNWEDLRNPKGDGDYNDVNLIVNVTGADPVDGCGVAVGQMTFDVGTDVVGHSFSVEAPTGVTSATETVTTSTSTSGDGRFITIEAETTGGDAVYTFVFDTTNGKYEFTQYRQLDHDQDGSTPADHDDLLALGFTVTLTDGDGDTASAVATINIDDDGPSAQADAIYTDETPGVQGNTDEIFVSDTPTDFPDLVQGHPLSIAKESLSFDFGKDKIGGKVDLTNADGNAYNGELSGLKDATTDQDIKLYSEDENTVVGRLDSGEIVFVAYMSHSTSSESADLYFAQYRGIEHPNTGSHDEDINLNTLFYTVTDGDGDTATANIRVNIDDDGPGLDNETANHLRESDLHNNGTDKVTGYFSGFYGADGAGSIEITDLKFVKDPDYANGAKVPFTSGGKDIEFGDPVADGGFMVLTGVAAIGPNGEELPVITLKVDNNGYYEIILHEAVDHPDANRTGYRDELEPHFEVVITDADGDTDTATLKFHITDDGVKAVDDTNAADAVQEDSDLVAVGNVLTNDDQGADGAVVTTTSEMVGTYGSVTINADGSYTYTLNNGAANVQALADGETVYDTFTYRMEDADGDSDTAELKIKITGSNDAPVAVDDGVLPAGVPITGTVPDFELTKDVSERTLGTSFGAQNAGRQVTITFDAETGGSWDPFGGNQDTFTVEINGVEVLVTHDRGTNSYSFDVVTKDDGGIEIKFFGDITGSDESLTISNLTAIRGPGWPDGSLTTDENAALTVDVLANDTDVDNGDDPSTFSLDAVSFASGLPADLGATPAGVSIVGNKLVFDPGTSFDYLAEGETATVVVDYTMSDDSGASASATATIVVTGSNDAPVAVDDIVLTNVQGEIDIPDWALLQNDTDVDGDALTVDGVSNPVDGTVAHDAGSEVVTFTLEGGDVSSLGFGSGSLKTISEGSGDGYDYNWFFSDWVSGVNNNGFGALAVDLPRTEWAQDNSVGNDIVHKIRFEGSLKSARDYDRRFGPNRDVVRKDADAFKVTLLAGEILSLSVLSSEGNPDFKLYSSSGVELDPDFTTGSYENTTGGQIEVYVRVEDNAPIARDSGRVNDYEVELSIDSTAIVTPATEGSFDYTAADGVDSDDANVSVEVQEGDTVTGTDADEILIGGDGDDTLIGGDGDDILIGGEGNDTLTGGAGADTFGFTGSLDSSNRDVVTDYNIAQGDVINVSDLVTFDDDANGGDISNYLQASNDGRGGISLKVNADGAGSDYETVAFLQGLDSSSQIKVVLDDQEYTINVADITG